MELPVVNMLTVMLMSSIALVSSYSSGAPSEACVDMVPGHGDPGDDPPPFTITPSSETYTPGQTIECKICQSQEMSCNGSILHYKTLYNNTNMLYNYMC